MWFKGRLQDPSETIFNNIPDSVYRCENEIFWNNNYRSIKWIIFSILSEFLSSKNQKLALKKLFGRQWQHFFDGHVPSCRSLRGLVIFKMLNLKQILLLRIIWINKHCACCWLLLCFIRKVIAFIFSQYIKEDKKFYFQQLFSLAPNQNFW